MITQNKLYWISKNILSEEFPDIACALTEPNGLLAIGGELNPNRLIDAYCQGIFPWYIEGQPVMWWSPDPRCILFPDEFTISRSLKKSLRKDKYIITFDKAFAEVVKCCAEPRLNDSGTWITTSIIKNYNLLYENGYAHSVECWYRKKLVGGLYGIAIGKIFFGESMFSHMTDTSKICLAHLVHLIKKLEYDLIDCQIYNNHLKTLGAKVIPRNNFSNILAKSCGATCSKPKQGWPSISDYKL